MSKKVFLSVLIIAVSCTENKKDSELKILNKTYLGDYYEKYNNEGVKIEDGYLNFQNKTGIVETYKDEKLKTVKILNNGEIICKADTNNFLFKSVRIDSNLILNQPKKWLGSKDVYPVIYKCVSPNKIQSIYNPTFSVTKQIIDNINFNQKDYIESTINYLIENLPQFQLITNGMIKVNGIEAFQFTYIFENDDILFGSVSTIYFIDKNIYILTGTSINIDSSKFMEYKSLFQLISSSLSIVK